MNHQSRKKLIKEKQGRLSSKIAYDGLIFCSGTAQDIENNEYYSYAYHVSKDGKIMDTWDIQDLMTLYRKIAYKLGHIPSEQQPGILPIDQFIYCIDNNIRRGMEHQIFLQPDLIYIGADGKISIG